MAFPAISGGGITNWDTLTGGSGASTTLNVCTISNGTTLKINTDSYLCANQTSLTGSLDTVAFSGTGGKVLIDGRDVRVVAYTGGSGNVPAIGTTITNNGASAYFLGAWASWLVEPTASGSAMPATGFIKVRDITGGSYAAGAFTGITATASGADRAGWIEVRSSDTALMTIPRIGAFEVLGDWFELGTTTGARGQILACPTCATTAGTLPGVWIETSAGSGVYERYNAVGSMAAIATGPTDVRGKVVWHTTTGFRIGSDGTNNIGYLPATGCKVRVPNVFLHCCTRTAGSGAGPRVAPSTTNTQNATTPGSTRSEMATQGAGDISINYANCMWSNLWAQAYRVRLTNSGFNDYIYISECASPLDIDNIIVAPNTSAITYAAATFISCFAGGTVQNSTIAGFGLTASGRYINNLQYVTGVTFSGVRTMTLLNKGNVATGTWTCTQPVNCTWTNQENIGGRLLLVGAQNCTFNNLGATNTFSGQSVTTYADYAIEATIGCNGITVDGMNFILSTASASYAPYAGLVYAAASYNILVKNIGTYAAKLNLGVTATWSGVLFGSGGNNAGITLKRIYTTGTRTGLHSLVNSDTDILLEHVYGDYADTTVMAGLNALQKNCGLTSATTGQQSVYGTHWQTCFLTTTTGFTEILCNEPTASSAAQCAIQSGTPQFNSSGQVLMTAVGQQIIWEMPFYAIGYTAFTNSAPTITGTNVTYSSGARWGNHDIEFQIDTGSGYGGSWLALTAANLTAQTISATTGFKLKVRVTCATAAATNAITNMRIAMTTTDGAQGSNQYALTVATVVVSGLVTGSRVKAYKVSDSTVLTNQAETAGTVSFTTEYIGAISIEARKASATPYYLPWVTQLTTISGSTVSATALQQLDE